MLSNVAASFAGHFLGGKGVSGLEKGLKRVELTVVGEASSVSSSDGRGSDGMAGIGDGGSDGGSGDGGSGSVSSVSRGSNGVSGVGDRGSGVGSNGGSDGSNGKGLLVDVGLSGDLDINVGLSSGVEVGVGNGRIVRSSIDSTVGNSRGSSDNGAGSVADSTGVASSSSVAVTSGSSVAVASVSTGRQNDSSVGHGQTGKGGNLEHKKCNFTFFSRLGVLKYFDGLEGSTYEGLHCDCEYCYCCRNRLKLKCSGPAFILQLRRSTFWVSWKELLAFAGLSRVRMSSSGWSRPGYAGHERLLPY